MAFDPTQEDFTRLLLGRLKHDGTTPDDAGPRSILPLLEEYRRDPSPFITNDADRSFHLMATAAHLLDQNAPFVQTEEEAAKLEDEAADALVEAVKLDEGNWDAQRMLAELDAEGNDLFLDYLIEHVDEVRASLDERFAAITESGDPYEREFALGLLYNPYQRWRAAIASRALICGRYRVSLAAAEECLAFNPLDLAGARFTAVLAMAKLEASPAEIDAFWAPREADALPMPTRPRRGRRGAAKRVNPWLSLARMASCYRALDFEGAERELRGLVRYSPHAAEILAYQTELPEGIFARLNVEPGTDDEMALALSEATPLIQEGMGTPERSGFSAWIANHELVRRGCERERASAVRSESAGGER